MKQVGDWLDENDIDPPNWTNYLDSLVMLGYLEPILFQSSTGAEGWRLSKRGIEAYKAMDRTKE